MRWLSAWFFRGGAAGIAVLLSLCLYALQAPGHPRRLAASNVEASCPAVR